MTNYKDSAMETITKSLCDYDINIQYQKDLPEERSDSKGAAHDVMDFILRTLKGDYASDHLKKSDVVRGMINLLEPYSPFYGVGSFNGKSITVNISRFSPEIVDKIRVCNKICKLIDLRSITPMLVFTTEKYKTSPEARDVLSKKDLDRIFCNLGAVAVGRCTFGQTKQNNEKPLPRYVVYDLLSVQVRHMADSAAKVLNYLSIM